MIEGRPTPDTTHEPATEQFASKAWIHHWTSPLCDGRRHEHGSTLDVSVVAGVSPSWFAAHTDGDSRANLPQARRSLHRGRIPSTHFNDLRTKSRSAAQSLRNMLVRATAHRDVSWICYRAILILGDADGAGNSAGRYLGRHTINSNT